MRQIPTVDEIESIIHDDVCGQCPALYKPNECVNHQERCKLAYHRQAEKIHAAMPRTTSWGMVDYCEWEPDESYTASWETPDTFNGTCGVMYTITEYDGQDFKTIGMNFCPGCGKPIKQLPRKHQGDDDDE